MTHLLLITHFNLQHHMTHLLITRFNLQRHMTHLLITRFNLQHHMTHLQHLPQSTSHKLIPQVYSEVKVIWRVDYSVDELHARQLEGRVTGLLKGCQNWVKATYATLVPIDCDCLHHLVVSEGGEGRWKGGVGGKGREGRGKRG